MKTSLKLFISAFLFLSAQFINAQGYKISVRINGLKNDTIYLGYHYSDKKYVVDTVVANENGEAIFEGKDRLVGGIYLIIMPRKIYFEVLICAQQNFSLETDTADYVKYMKIKGSDENLRFADYHRYMREKQEIMTKLQQRLEKNKDNTDSSKILNEKFNSQRNEILDYQKKIVKNNPEATFSKIVNALIEPEVPPAPLDEKGKPIDSLFAYHYYKAHYFDNFDVTDSCLLRTPFYNSKIDFYFSKMVVQTADSLIPEVDAILKKVKNNKMALENLTGHLCYYFETSKIMGMDAIFVHIADNYYLNGMVTADTTFLRKLKDRVKAIRPNILGNKAPELKMMTPAGEWISLHQTRADYTILVFWEPGCGHCKTEIPKLKKEVYEKIRNENIVIFAVYTQRDTTEWLKFIREHDLDWLNVYDPYYVSGFRDKYDIFSTPVIYILDKDKRIIYKRISVENILPALYFKMGRKKELDELEKLRKEAESKETKHDE
ncbi:MAG: redoxin domain-containing protein [Bacteroidia bacterium]|nr:redoxin domain-containing protein [Bacteroidia bacterium]